MGHFIDFIAKNWVLSTLFVVLLITFCSYEARSQGYGLKILSQDLVRKINDNAVTIFDIRSIDAFKIGHITKSKRAEESDLLAEESALAKLNGGSAVIVCSNGTRSGRLVAQLKKRFSDLDLLALNGGVDEWGKKNLPLQAGKK